MCSSVHVWFHLSGGWKCAMVGVPWRGSVSACLAWGDLFVNTCLRKCRKGWAFWDTVAHLWWHNRKCLNLITANLCTKILDFRRFDSSIILNFEGWNSQDRRAFPGKVKSRNLSREYLGREIGRTGFALFDTLGRQSGRPAAPTPIIIIIIIIIINNQ